MIITWLFNWIKDVSCDKTEIFVHVYRHPCMFLQTRTLQTMTMMMKMPEEEADNVKNQDIYRGKQSSGKSLQSATSIEEEWSDDDQSPSKKANGTPRVSFKQDDDIKEMVGSWLYIGSEINFHFVRYF